jgi:TRAP-type C4-dicarboxylate transport system substrate-binding protein
MMMGRWFKTCSMALGVFFFWGFLSSIAFAKTIILNYSSGYGENFSLSMHDRWWAQELEKRSGGKVKIEFYWSQGLVKIPESLEAASSRITDISFFATGYFGGQLPLSTSSQLFYLTEKPDAMSRGMMDVYNSFPAFRDEYEKKNNVKVLTFSGCTPNIVGVRKPWKGLRDFEGKKIRVFPGWEEAVSKLGGTPVTISWGEIYTSLENGVIDAYTGTMWDLAGIGKFYEQAPYILDLKQGSCAMAVTVINLDSWNKLPDDVKKLMEEVTKESIDKQAELYMEADARIYKVYKDAKVKTLEFSPEDVKKFKDLIVPKRWDNWKKDIESKSLPGVEFFDMLTSAIKKHEPKSTYVSPFIRYQDLKLK